MDQLLMRTTVEVEEHHWWYRGRRAVLGAELARLQLPPNAQVLDAGCGSGRTMLDLAPLGEVSGLDLDEWAASLARARGDFDVEVGPVEELPWPAQTFDLITCLDVIEHTVDDHVGLSELLRVARPGCRLLVTVPAYGWLWSRHDVLNHHQRRYTRRSLLRALEAAGWRVERATYFNSLLLPVAAVVRALQRRVGDEEELPWDLSIGPRWVHRVLELPMRAEARWLGSGATLPAGVSVLAVAQRI